MARACPKCGQPLNLRRGKRGPWLGCSTFPKCRGRFGWTKLEDDKQKALLTALETEERSHTVVIIARRDGTHIPPETPVSELVIPGGTAKLDLYAKAG